MSPLAWWQVLIAHEELLMAEGAQEKQHGAPPRSSAMHGHCLLALRSRLSCVAGQEQKVVEQTSGLGSRGSAYLGE